MNKKNISRDVLDTTFLKGLPLIDVRAPVEYSLGSLPNAINLPLLNDDERAQVGTTYKQKGREEALRLGHELISGSVKRERVKAWTDYIKKNPEAIIYCFRGGLRSQITQQWLRDEGFDVPLIVGGYKLARNYLMERMNEVVCESNFMLVSGPTGSGKTKLINSCECAVDLEEMALHRGSVFGSRSLPQPTQINFENNITVALIRQTLSRSKKIVLFEDESRLIGKNVIPSRLFDKMRESSVIWIDEDLSVRVQNIFTDYILKSDFNKLVLFEGFKKSVKTIEKKLGGLRANEIILLIDNAIKEFSLSGTLEPNKNWIEKLLVYYYDPLYLSSIQRRGVKIAFKGSYGECQKFISQL